MKSIFTKKGVLSILICVSMLVSAIPALKITSYAGEYDTNGATCFTFSNSKISAVDGEYTGYKIEGTALTIKDSGTYILSGSCSDGSVTVKKGTDNVTLILKGLTLTSSETAPICCNKSSHVTIVAYSGSVNNLTDSEKNNDENYPDNELAENAVIKCKDGSQVILSGTGTLNIKSNSKNGIKSGASTDEDGKAGLTVKDLNLNVTADLNDGINAEAKLSVLSGNITVSAADDGIHSDYFMTIGSNGSAGPDITIKKSEEGIEAANLDILSGNINITSNDDGINAANSDLDKYNFSITISGGTVNINAENGDGIDSNGTLTISGGNIKVFSASTGDNQPLDCESELSVTGGTVLGVGSAGMGTRISQESQPYVIFGDSSAMGFGNHFKPEDMNNRNSSGMDRSQPPSNSNMNGLQPPSNSNMNGIQPPSDSNMNGGKPSMLGNDTKMLRTTDTNPPQIPSGDSNFNPGEGGQNNPIGNSSVIVTSGNTANIKDSSGKSIYSFIPVRNAGYVFFSSGSIETGKTYSLFNGNSESTTSVAGENSGNNMNPTPFNPNDNTNPVSNTDYPGNNTDENNPQGSQRNPMSFTDVSSGDWYNQAVEFVYSKGLMNGISSDCFNPNGKTTRGMIVSILYRLYKDTFKDSDISESGSTDCTFKDIESNAYYADAVKWAASKEIVTGYNSSTFGPNDEITREQLASILYRYFNFINNGNYTDSNSDSNVQTTKFSDYSKVSSYATEGINWVLNNGIMNGTTDSTIEPTGKATRAQAAAVIMRFCSI